jgi:hypothetical protein
MAELSSGKENRRDEMQVSTHPSAQFRVGLGRAGLGLGCAIRTLGNHP